LRLGLVASKQQTKQPRRNGGRFHLAHGLVPLKRTGKPATPNDDTTQRD
jgi:hypothetical protein